MPGAPVLIRCSHCQVQFSLPELPDADNPLVQCSACGRSFVCVAVPSISDEVRSAQVMVRWHCPKCDRFGDSNRTFAGQPAKCECGNVVIIPATPMHLRERQPAGGIAPASPPDSAVKSGSPPIATDDGVNAHWKCPSCTESGKAERSLIGMSIPCKCGATAPILPGPAPVAPAPKVTAVVVSDSPQPEPVRVSAVKPNSPARKAREARRPLAKGDRSRDRSRRPAAPKKKSNPALTVGVIAAGVLVLVITLIALTSSDPEPGKPEAAEPKAKTPIAVAPEIPQAEDPDANFNKSASTIQALLDAEPVDLEAIDAGLKELSQLATKPAQEEKVAQLRSVLDVAADRISKERFDEIMPKIDKALAGGNISEANNLLDGFSPMRDTHGTWEREISRVRRRIQDVSAMDRAILRLKAARQKDDPDAFLEALAELRKNPLPEAQAAAREMAKQLREWGVVDSGQPGDTPPPVKPDDPVAVAPPTPGYDDSKNTPVDPVNPVDPGGDVFSIRQTGLYIPIAIIPLEGKEFKAHLLALDESGVVLDRDGQKFKMAWNQLYPYTVVRILSMFPDDRDALLNLCQQNDLFELEKIILAGSPNATSEDLDDTVTRQVAAFIPGGTTENAKALSRELKKLSDKNEEDAEQKDKEEKQKLFKRFKIADISTLVDRGDTSKRVDVVFISDGWSERDIRTFDKIVDRLAKKILTVEPISNYPSYVNVHKVTVLERESGLTGVTALQSIVQGDVLTSNDNMAWEYALKAPDADLIVVIANVKNVRSTGGGGVLTLDASGDIDQVAIHEIGHALADLDDEYVDKGTAQVFPDYGPAEEPDHYNTTRVSDPMRSKWHYWVKNPPKGWKIGCFEGGYYRELGYYRPAMRCRMNDHADPLCPVCFEQLEKSLYMLVSPIDASFPVEDHVVLFKDDELEFTADAVVTEGDSKKLGSLTAAWYVDGLSNSEFGVRGRQTYLAARKLALPPGDHELQVRVNFHNTRVRRDNGLLSSTRSWRITQLPWRKPEVAFSGDKSITVGKSMRMEIKLDEDSMSSGLTLDAIGLPSGATFDPENAAITWTPEDRHRGSHIIRVGVRSPDGEMLLVVERPFAVLKEGKANNPPYLKPVPKLHTLEGLSFYVYFEAFDPDGDMNTFYAEGLPDGAWLDPQTGEMVWPVRYSQGGREYTFTVFATDGTRSGTAETEVTIRTWDRIPEETELKDGQAIMLMLNHWKPDMRMVGLSHLRSFPIGFQVLEAIRLLRDRDPQIRQGAVQLLNSILGAGDMEEELHLMLLNDVEDYIWQFTDAPEVLQFIEARLEYVDQWQSARKLRKSCLEKFHQVKGYNLSRGIR